MAVSNQALDENELFLEACVQALETVGLMSFLKQPPQIGCFLHAYLLARCLPMAVDRRARGHDFMREEQIDDELMRFASKAEQFLNEWEPQNAMEAAMMVDVAHSLNQEPAEGTGRILVNVGNYLIDQAEKKSDFGDLSEAIASLNFHGQDLTQLPVH